MAIELAPHNIQVNAIAPGWIETEMTAPVRTPPMIAMAPSLAEKLVMAFVARGRWRPSDRSGPAFQGHFGSTTLASARGRTGVPSPGRFGRQTVSSGGRGHTRTLEPA